MALSRNEKKMFSSWHAGYQTYEPTVRRQVRRTNINVEETL